MCAHPCSNAKIDANAKTTIAIATQFVVACVCCVRPSLQSASGAPVVELHGHAKDAFDALGLTTVKVSISHSAGVAVAQALAM